MALEAATINGQIEFLGLETKAGHGADHAMALCSTGASIKPGIHTAIVEVFTAKTTTLEIL